MAGTDRVYLRVWGRVERASWNKLEVENAHIDVVQALGFSHEPGDASMEATAKPELRNTAESCPPPQLTSSTAAKGEEAARREIEAGLVELGAGQGMTLDAYEREMDAFVVRLPSARG